MCVYTYVFGAVCVIIDAKSFSFVVFVPERQARLNSTLYAWLVLRCCRVVVHSIVARRYLLWDQRADTGTGLTSIYEKKERKKSHENII